MPVKIRQSPTIPDHEVLRKIGGGAYGEVWLARGVTGALRAVKVVWREDFEDERGFEREFEGILKFEPISRDHPALMNILHVGRSPDGVSFYYYVMELGDDVSSGQDINPIEYEPRTLRADNHQGPGVQWDTSECIDVGLRLAEALDHLHERGLAHRDVKPSNVIFVNGRAKLADIGLVAMRGQRTFVGTEGFVPPEGPGSAQADVYSLGKVLYEIATGKDRLAFPELPDEMPSGTDRKRWLELNKIICDICEPRISKRKILSAAQLADALRRLQRGKRRRQNGRAVWMTTFLLTAFTGWAGWELARDSDWLKSRIPGLNPIPEQVGMLRVVSAPEGAEVTDVAGRFLGMTNTGLMKVRVGDEFNFTMKKPGYKPSTVKGKVPPTVVMEPYEVFAKLENFSPPQEGERWSDHLRNAYQPVGREHVSSGYLKRSSWQKFATAVKLPEGRVEWLNDSENGKPAQVVLCSEADAQAYSRWMRDGGLREGFLTDDHEVLPMREISLDHPGRSARARQQGLVPFRLKVRFIPYGEITLTTDPPGVEVYMNAAADSTNQVSVGSTAEPLLIPRVKPGKWQLYLVREGYKPQTVDLKVGEGEKVATTVKMEKSLGVIFGTPWKNGIGMRFEPLGTGLMVSIWETRVRDFEQFVKESNRPAPRPPDFEQTPNHPVVNVSREDAQAFCRWLTERERKDERIAQTHQYRLPTDLEWSLMAGLKEEEGISPSSRYARKQRVYPWGTEWPENQVVGNFADASAAATPMVSIDRTIPGYDDGFPYTAPVGSFPASATGLYDLSGNVQEWVEDESSKLGKNVLGVLRGGGWTTYQADDLYTGSRNAAPPTFQDIIHGFRVVLAKVPPPKSE
jgi:serine/threonine protein kinase/formylglycine-generating enzyme required for sulfatase activity